MAGLFKSKSATALFVVFFLSFFLCKFNKKKRVSLEFSVGRVLSVDPRERCASAVGEIYVATITKEDRCSFFFVFLIFFCGPRVTTN